MLSLIISLLSLIGMMLIGYSISQNMMSYNKELALKVLEQSPTNSSNPITPTPSDFNKNNAFNSNISNNKTTTPVISKNKSQQEEKFNDEEEFYTNEELFNNQNLFKNDNLTPTPTKNPNVNTTPEPTQSVYNMFSSMFTQSSPWLGSIGVKETHRNLPVNI